jgi:pilus assembly protein CpaE
LADKIRLLIVDDIADTRTNLGKLLMFDESVEVIGEAENGEEAVVKALGLSPDVVLMDINMPVMDGIQATERISVEQPRIGIIILSVQGEQEYLRKAMAAGARDYLVKPPTGDDLVNTIKHVFELQKKRQAVLADTDESPYGPGQVISVFSTKGGVGKTTIAVNLAVALAQLPGRKTVIVDLDLQFGDVAMMLDVIPRRTIADLAGEADLLNIKTVEGYLADHVSGLRVLPAPIRPEYAEMVTARQVEVVLKTLKENFDFVIVDTRQVFDDITLTALDQSDQILTVAALDVLTVKNIKLGLEVMASLHYESAKIKMLLNRSNTEMGITPRDLENNLKFPINHMFPSDGKLVLTAVNKGVPFVTGEPKAPLTEAIFKLARELGGIREEKKEKTSGAPWRNLFGR